MIPLDHRRDWIEPGHPVLSISEQCRIAEVPRSSFYYQKDADNAKDHEAMKVMDQLYLKDYTLGTRRYVEELKDHGFLFGRDKVRSLMQTMGICAVYRKPRTTVIDPAKYKFPYLLRGYKTVRSNEVWSIDISYIRMKQGFMYLFAIIDVHSRYLVSWGISNSMEADWVVKIIQSAVKKHGKPQIINSDQGSQFTSDEYVNAIKDMKDVRISMDGKGRAIDNVWVERFFRTLKHEHVYLNPSKDGSELHQSVKSFANYYNNRRKHSSLEYQTPASVYYAHTKEKGNQGIGSQSIRHRKDIACLPESQGQALRVCTEKIAGKSNFFGANLDIRSGMLMLAAKRIE